MAASSDDPDRARERSEREKQANGCLVVAGILLLGCFFGNTDDGRVKAREQGFRHATPVVAALDRYHADHGLYPSALDSLAPAYLHTDALLAFDEGGDRFAYQLKRDSSYVLRFAYGRADHVCRFLSRTASWDCDEYP